MTAGKRVVFVSDEKFLHAPLPGGVQICTRDYWSLLEACGLEVVPFPISHTRNLLTRVKIKLGVELYERYDFKQLATLLFEQIVARKAGIVALNQVDLIPFAPLLRRRFGQQLRIVVLSHGNESGDFLHSIVRNDQSGYWGRLRDITRLGFAIYAESHAFIHCVDAVFCISETETQINRWLGAHRTFFVPRTFAPRYLDWQPDLSRIGFVGTLNHLPNIGGLTLLLEALAKHDLGDLKVRVVGAPDRQGKALQRRFPFVDYLGSLDQAALEKEASQWSFFLNPVFWYARGASTKLAQAVNWGLPVASTPAGNRGYEWKRGTLLTAETPADLAGLILKNRRIEKVRDYAAQSRLVAESGPSFREIAERIEPWLLA